MRIAELPLEQHRAVVEERHDRHRAGMADVLARALAAIGQVHHVAVHLEQLAVEDALAAGEMLFEVLHLRTGKVAAQISMSRCGSTPSSSRKSPLAEITSRPTACGRTMEGATGSSKYMSFTTRR